MAPTRSNAPARVTAGPYQRHSSSLSTVRERNDEEVKVPKIEPLEFDLDELAAEDIKQEGVTLEKASRQKTPYIRVQDIDQHCKQKYVVPITDELRTWPGLQRALLTLFSDGEKTSYDIMTVDGDLILQQSWSTFVHDGLVVDPIPSNNALCLPDPTASGEQHMLIRIWDMCRYHRDFPLLVADHTTFGQITAALYGKDRLRVRCTHDQQRYSSYTTMEEADVQPGDGLDMHGELLGGKPVITCYPLQSTNLHVTLALADGLDFSYLHPFPPGITVSDLPTLRAASWTVTAKPNGELVDHTTQRSYAQLFWEATQTSYRQMGTRAAPINTSMHDNTRNLLVTPDLFPSFVDDLMIRLGFQVKERQEFVTYWGPQLISHPFFLMKLLRPDEYASAALLSVTPKPDRVVRLFIVFDRLTTADVSTSQYATTNDLDREVDILLEGKPAPVVGSVDDGFVVFEWGGMIA